MDRYPKMTVKELLYLIECRIEGERFVISPTAGELNTPGTIVTNG